MIEDDADLDMNADEYRDMKRNAWARDLRGTAIHEFAHLHVARHFGIFGWIDIKPRDAGNWVEEKQFTGSFTQERTEDATANRMIGLAGVCAEQIDHDFNALSSTMMELLDPEYGDITLSATDAGAAAGFDESHVAQCLDLVRSLWPAIFADAERHIAAETRLSMKD